MTKEQIRIVIAELHGWNTTKEKLGNVFIYRDKQGNCRASLPNYPEDLNACAELEKNLSNGEFMSYLCWLFKITCKEHPDRSSWGKVDWSDLCSLFIATPLQRCEAFIKTVAPERWVE